jgi:hypothetical protein
MAAAEGEAEEDNGTLATAIHPFLSLSLPIACTVQEQLWCARQWMRQTLPEQPAMLPRTRSKGIRG